jgi:glycosyltransferase involved in cell wall biosynthesis
MNRTEPLWPRARVASAEDAVASLRACLSPASFWTPERLGPQVSWVEHAPFAFWLIEALRPRVLVELGTHGGFSYFSFCDAVQRCGLSTRCYAVDTWTGDEHAGFYGEAVYRDVAAHNEGRYSGFSALVRSTFDQALGHFSDGTIDLLHVDGRHFYDDVKHDFASWRAKLSARAVVLFHDTNVRERDFGVFRRWEELRQNHPHFEFLHGHGLGVLGVGAELPPPVRDLLNTADDAEATSHIRNAYARLGSAISFMMRERDLSLKSERLESESKQARIETETACRDLAAVSDELTRLSGERSAEVARLTAEVARLTANVSQERAAAESAQHTLAAQKAEVARLTADVAQERAAVEAAQHTLAAQNEALRNDIAQLAEARLRVADLEAQLSGRATEQARLAAALLPAADHIADLEAQVAVAWEDVAQLKEDLGGARSRRAELEEKLATRAAEAARQDAELVRTRGHAGQLARELERSQRQLEWMLSSTSWRLTRPLRRLGTASPKLRRKTRRLMDTLWLREVFGSEAGLALARRERTWNPGLDWLKSRLGTPDGTPEEQAANCRLLAASGLIDEGAYRAAVGINSTASVAEHYVTVGWRQGFEPGPRFEGRFLEPYYRSVGLSGPPAITYLKLREFGWPVYATQAEAETIARVIRGNDLFDGTAYATAAGDFSGLDPVLHYVIIGERAGLAPSDRFDPDYYGDRYPDVGQAPINRLEHFISSGRLEGRRTLPVTATLNFDRSRLKSGRETVLIIVHEASRTGAPILAYNVAKRLRRTRNVVALLLAGGGLVEDFEACCHAVIGPLTYADWHPGEIKHLMKHVLAAFPASYAIVNSIASWMSVPPLGRALVPVVLLVHEFASYTRPKSAMAQGLHWATEIVFSADLVARSAREEHPTETRRPLHVFPQGHCDLPPVRERITNLRAPPDLRSVFRPRGAEDALVVLGCGFVHIRKGVDLFLSCAAAVAAMQPRRPVRFIWIGAGYDPEEDAAYSCYLADQITRSGLQETVEIIDEVTDLEPAYAMSDVFFLSSRLDPLPNVTVDAAVHGIPIVCFEGASGMADILAAHPETRPCVVPHLDVHAAAAVIVELANDEAKRREVGESLRNIGQATFDMDGYVARIAALGNQAKRVMRQRTEDIATLTDDPMFDPIMYLPFDASRIARDEAIVDFVARWALVGTTPASRDYFFRRPCAGFHPQIYAHAHADSCDVNMINPLAHFIRSGKPDGPWRHDVITPASRQRSAGPDVPSTALHAHFHYPELAEDFFRKFDANQSRCDLLLSTDQRGKAKILREVTAQYRRGDVHIRLVPNRGRDIGAFLTAFGADLADRYEIVGHVHGKRCLFASGSSDPFLGDRWREFLWQNLLGDQHPMMDIVIARMTADDKLGLVFPDNPQLPSWDGNRAIAQELAQRMGMTDSLAPFFDFPVGTMFWARTAALKPLLDLGLGWDDYPEEPVATDGTVLHAIERLLPFTAWHAGYRYAGTLVPGLTW